MAAHTNVFADCGCTDSVLPENSEERAVAFYSRRQRCRALKLTIPDTLLEKHFAFSKSSPDEAFHCSVPFLAYCRGNLPEFTDLIHRYLLDGDQLRPNVTLQYENDLREKWFVQSDPTARYRAFRLYESRIAELTFVRWLEREKWKITGLEAYGDAFDVSATAPTGESVDFEVKFLAQREVLFELNRASFHSPTVGRLGVYSPVDYLLFRVYEAALQLENAQNTRIAVAIVKNYGLSYKIPLTENWIDWANPGLLRRESEIEKFLARQYDKNPDLDSDIGSAIAAIDQVWILKDNGPFELELAHRFATKSTQRE